MFSIIGLHLIQIQLYGMKNYCTVKSQINVMSCLRVSLLYYVIVRNNI